MSDSIGSGLRINYIIPDSPAERAGVRVGDILLHINGMPISTVQDYVNAKGTLKTYPVGVLRGNEYIAMQFDCNEPAVPAGVSATDVLRLMGKLPSLSYNN